MQASRREPNCGVGQYALTSKPITIVRPSEKPFCRLLRIEECELNTKSLISNKKRAFLAEKGRGKKERVWWTCYIFIS